MRKIFIILFLLPVLGFSQYYWDYGVVAGGSTYLGEMGGKEKTRRDWILDMKLPATRWSIGGFARYKVHPDWYLKGTLNYVRLYGADRFSLNPARVGRNLDFRNDIFEFFGTVERVLYYDTDVGNTGRYALDFSWLVYGGAGLMHHNPKGDLNGKWIALQPLRTEAQDKPYSRFQFIIPVGTEVFFTYRTRKNQKHRFGLDFNWRITFTDYLDDASTTYPTEDQQANMSSTALALSNKTTPEVISSIQPQEGYPMVTTGTYRPGRKRGDPTNNDHYLTISLTYSKVIRGKSNFYRKHYGFAGKRKRGSRRRSRAKF